VRGRDDWWRRKQEIADGSAQPPATQPKAPIELPLPSYVPLLASLSLTIAAAGMVWQVYPVVGIGLALLLMSLVAWALEPNHPTGPAHHSAQPQPGSQPIQQPTSD